MTEEKNTRVKPKQAREPLKMPGNIGRGVSKFLGGEMIQSGTFRFFPYLVFIAILAFIYIANNYYAEDKIRQINQHRKQLKEIRYEYITTKSELTSMTKQLKTRSLTIKVLLIKEKWHTYIMTWATLPTYPISTSLRISIIINQYHFLRCQSD